MLSGRVPGPSRNGDRRKANEANADKAVYLARTSNADGVVLTDQSRWQYYGGTSGGSPQWVSACSGALPLRPTAEMDFSVIRVNGLFWLVRNAPAAQTPGKIVALPARTPWGFGADQIDLDTPPETKIGPDYPNVYGVRVHPGILSGDGRVVISYTVGTSGKDLNCWTRGYYFPEDYRPRFIDIPTSSFFSTKVP